MTGFPLASLLYHQWDSGLIDLTMVITYLPHEKGVFGVIESQLRPFGFTKRFSKADPRPARSGGGIHSTSDWTPTLRVPCPWYLKMYFDPQPLQIGTNLCFY